MKTVRKLTAMLLCLALMFALAACGSFEQRMLKAATKMEKLESYHMDADVELCMNLSMMGRDMDMDMFFRTATDLRRDPMQVYSRMSAEMLGESSEILTYVFAGEEEGSFDAYASLDGGESWGKKTLDAEELKEELSLNSPLMWSSDFLRDAAKTFEEAGKEEINGSQATRYDGVIEGEAVGQALEASGVFNSMSEALPLDMSELLDQFSGTIPVSLWLDDRSGMLVRYDMDMTEAFASVWDAVMAEVMDTDIMSADDLADLGMSMTLEKLSLSAVLSDFDAVGEIVLPESAKDA